MDKIYYSHIKKDKQNNFQKNEKGEIIGKLLSNHHKEVYNIALKNLYPYLGFNIEMHEIEEIVKFSALFHDFGKYTDFFQDYLKNIFYGEEKKHSFISSVLICNYLLRNQILCKRKVFIIYNIIKNHHGKMDLSDDINKKYLISSFPNQVNNLLKNKLFIEKEIGINFNDEYFIIKDLLENNKNNFFDIFDEKNIENYFTINYFFSLLIEADKINASNTKIYTSSKINSNIVSCYIGRTKKIDNKRDKVRREIEENINKIEVDKSKLFTLTAPTGIGKTLSSMNFALKLRDKIYNKKKILPKIIYCLPFINIIDQTVEEFENIFKNEKIKIIKHHQYSDIFSKFIDNENDSEYTFNNIKMEIETWQGDIIVTTFVQFLHTLIGNKNKLLKKFNHYAGSIIILDEIQSINYEYIPLVGAMLYYLTEKIDSKIIIMTATQPALFNNLSKLNIHNLIEPFELLRNNKEYFEELNRTKIVSLINKECPIINNEDFIKIFERYHDEYKSYIIVLNTIKRAQDIFNLISRTYKNCFFLSTSIVPKQRRLVIKKIKKSLKYNERLNILLNKLINHPYDHSKIISSIKEQIKEKRIILISTQCIEAGIDINFDIGYRDIGPLDSIIQVAGRINRNNDPNKKDSPLYLVNFFKDSTMVYGSEIPSKVIDIITKYNEIYEKDYKIIVNKYFSINWNYDKSKEIFEAIERFDTIGINKFQLIEEKDEFVDLFIDFYNGKNSMVSILNRYIEAIKNNDNEKISYLKKRFNMCVISISIKKLTHEIENNMIYERLYFIDNKILEKYYDKKIGFKLEAKEDFIFVF